MGRDDALGPVEFAVLDAVHRGRIRRRRTALQIPPLGTEPAGEVVLHDVLRRCEANGLLRSRRDTFGRRYELTGAGRAQLRADRRFRLVLARLLLRGHRRT
jgi:hypothetical protein